MIEPPRLRPGLLAKFSYFQISLGLSCLILLSKSLTGGRQAKHIWHIGLLLLTGLSLSIPTDQTIDNIRLNPQVSIYKNILLVIRNID